MGFRDCNLADALRLIALRTDRFARSLVIGQYYSVLKAKSCPLPTDCTFICRYLFIEITAHTNCSESLLNLVTS